MKPEELERQFSPGELILERGSQNRELYVVRSGNVLLDPDDGSEPRMVGAGAIFGELNAVLGGPSPYRAEAESDVAALVLDAAGLNQLCEQNAEFSMRLILHLAEQLAAACSSRGAVTGANASLKRGYRRLVPVLFDRCMGHETPAPIEGRLRDLAQDAGLSMLDTYFCIQRLLERRLVRLVDDQLALIEPEPLRELAD